MRVCECLLINWVLCINRAAEEAYPDLARRYENYGRPATVIFDGNGIEIIRRRGYLRPQWLLWLLEAVAQNPSPEAHR